MSDNLQDISANREDTIALAKANLNMLAALAIPDVFRYMYPDIFLAIWQMLQVAIEKTKGKDYLALGLPRGFGKTIILKLYVLYLILFTDRKFILIVCNTAELAENFLSDVADMLSSANIVAIFGDWRLTSEKDKLNQKKFSFRGRPVTLAALGAGSSLRGLNIKFVRPDVIIMDDMQSREQAESTVESMKTITWMIGTLMKAAAPERCLYIFVGNMYPFEGSILKKLKYNNAWISFICAAIREDGESIWPELKPVDELLIELENDTSLGHPEIFYSEVMNDEEAGTRSGIDISRIRSYSDRDLPEWWHSGAVIIDPSLGTKKSDDVAIGVMCIYDTKPVLRQLEVGKFNPKETIRKAITLALHYQLPAIVVESVAYQATLVFWFNHFINQLGVVGLEALPVASGRANKNSQIIASLKDLVADEIQLHEAVRSQVVNQITHFNPLKTNNKDDILDVIRYMRKVMADYPWKIQRPLLTSAEVSTSVSAFTDTLAISF